MKKVTAIVTAMFVIFSLFSLAACSLGDILGQGPSTISEEPSSAEAQEGATSDESASIRDLSGTWTGTLTENNGTIREMTLVILHAENASAFTGMVNFLAVSNGLSEEYEISGTTDGTLTQFSEPLGRYFWGTASGEDMQGQVAWNCYDCPDSAWASFSLARGASADTPVVIDPTGAWNGTLVETMGDLRTYDMSLNLTKEEGTNNFFGDVLFSLRGASMTEYYLVSGYTDGTYIRFNDSGTEVISLYFWGTISEGNVIEGFASRISFDDPLATYGTFNVSR